MSNSNGESSAADDLVEQFCSITGASKERAESMLEVCSNNLEMAINMHWESEDVSAPGGGVGVGGPDVIPVDDDDDDGPPPSTSSSSLAAALRDANGRAGFDAVRAPIPPTRGVLVEPPLAIPLLAAAERAAIRSRSARGVQSVFGGGLRDFQAETREQEERARRGLPVNAYDPSPSTSASNKQKRLEDLFRPPLDLIFGGTFQAARDAGTRDNRWLLVNIQNNQEFKCQMLNRDVWSDKRIRALVQENFLFWQTYVDTDDGERFKNFYPINDWPYFAVIDPRTGENLGEWHDTDANAVFGALTDFLVEHSSTPSGTASGVGPSATGGSSSASGSSSSMPPTKRARRESDRKDDGVGGVGGPARARSRSVIDMSEDSQLEAAIQASLAESHVSEEEESALDKSRAAESDGGGSDVETCTDSEDASCSSFSSPFRRKVAAAAAGGGDAAVPTALGAGAGPSGGGGGGATSAENSKRNLSALGFGVGGGGPKKNGASGDGGGGKKKADEQWRRFLGDEKDPESKLLLRLPDGKKVHVSMPCSSQIQAVITYAECLGFPPSKFEIVTAFPRKNISEMAPNSTLKEAGLFPQETVFVQAR